MRGTYAFGLAVVMAAALPAETPRAAEADNFRLTFARAFPGGTPPWNEPTDIK